MCAISLTAVNHLNFDADESENKTKKAAWKVRRTDGSGASTAYKAMDTLNVLPP